jgi:hypothetical protein
MKYAFSAVAFTSAIGSALAVVEWGQCGGINYTGSTTCDSGLTCVVINDCKRQRSPGQRNTLTHFGRLLSVPEGHSCNNHNHFGGLYSNYSFKHWFCQNFWPEVCSQWCNLHRGWSKRCVLYNDALADSFLVERLLDPSVVQLDRYHHSVHRFEERVSLLDN